MRVGILSFCFLLSVGMQRPVQQDSLFVVFWNLENFFDWKDDGISDSEREFSEAGERHWTKSRFYAKCNAIAKTVFLISDSYGRAPDALGFAEVENEFVLRQLVHYTPLQKLGYRIIHFESHDSRGIDCALLYRKETLELLGAEACHVYDEGGGQMSTRDILLARFKTISILVNHHPSKLGGKGDRRKCAMNRMLALCDSLSDFPYISMGDFNENVWGEKKDGTYKYNGGWDKIDGCFHSESVTVTESVFSHPYLTEEDRKYGGTKPRRTYSGPRYLGGVSDHYPVTFMVRFQPQPIPAFR